MTLISIRKSDLDKILVEARNKVNGIGTLRTDYNREQIAKAVFTISGQSFIRETNAIAGASRLRFHHVYEWGQTGNNSKRLFEITRSSVRGGKLTISSSFKDSKSYVPSVTSYGKSGKSYVFKKKATVMEAGRPVVIMPKTGKMLVFPNRDGKLIFTKKSFVRNPGGNAVRGSFEGHMKKWFANPSNINSAVMASGFMKDLEKEMALALNRKGAGISAANNVIKTVSTKYSQGKRVL
jgi:hypothetical protein